MTNAEMRPNRILKLQTGKRLYAKIVDHLHTGGTVDLCTHTRVTRLTAKHTSMIKMGESGSLYVQRGKNWDCIDYCGVRLN